ncbi:MAG: carbon-nitrogen hydrolase family protein [Gammaproteobacteria bacterium]|nr:MAG: carbon-nitrogen hydrolase family protein [Gammaproteobacteria bacterium]
MSQIQQAGQARVAAIQMVSSADVESNLMQAGQLLSEAARSGVQLAVLPENFACMPVRESQRLESAEPDGDGPIQRFLSRQARALGLWLVGGTIPLRSEEEFRPAAATLVFDDTGRRLARYDKIFLFDVAVPGRSESYRESDGIRPGRKRVVIDSPVGRLGLAVCYDLRFPELFRAMLESGLQTIALPAAFTAATGQDHWEILVRARAVENLCWVIAAGQGGRHDGGRETFGDSMIVDPWGAVNARLEHGPGVVVADIDLARQAEIRSRFPALEHRRHGDTIGEPESSDD